MTHSKEEIAGFPLKLCMVMEPGKIGERSAHAEGEGDDPHMPGSEGGRQTCV